MNKPVVKQRMRGLDVDTLIAYFLAAKKKLEDPRTTTVPHRRATALRTYAMYAYMAGAPLADVRKAALESVEEYGKVLAARPTVEVLSTPVEGEYPDYWIAASYETLKYVEWALVLHEPKLLPSLVAQLWDPVPPAVPRVDAIFRVAYATRELLLGREQGALSELARLPNNAKKTARDQAAVLSAIARKSTREVVESLTGLARSHRRAMANLDALPEEQVFCLPAAGFAALALDRGLLQLEDVPVDVDAFPHELVLDGRG